MSKNISIHDMISERNDLIDELQYAPEIEKPSLHLRIDNIETIISRRKNSYR